MIKKIILFLLFIVIINIGFIYPEEKYEFSLQFGSVGSFINLSSFQFGGEIFIEFFNLFFENHNNNIGFKLSPLYIGGHYSYSEDKYIFTEFNLWEPLKTQETIA